MKNKALDAELHRSIFSQPSDKCTVITIPVDGPVGADGEAEQSYYEGHVAVGEGDADQENGCYEKVVHFISHSGGNYRAPGKSMYFLLSRTQAGPGRTVKQEQEETSRNHVQTFSGCSVYIFRDFHHYEE